MPKRDLSAPVLPEPDPPNFMSGPGPYILPRQRPSKLLICWLILAASLALAPLSLLSLVWLSGCQL